MDSRTHILLYSAGFIVVLQHIQIRSLLKKLDYGRNQFMKMHDTADYLFTIIEENDYKLNDFDMIALTNILDDNSND